MTTASVHPSVLLGSAAALPAETGASRLIRRILSDLRRRRRLPPPQENDPVDDETMLIIAIACAAHF